MTMFQFYNNYLDDNPIFLFSYAKELYNSKNYKESLEILKKLEKYVLWYDSKVIESDCYAILKNNFMAEFSYKQAISMCPNRFIGRYKLLNFYINTKNKEKALKTAQDIVNLPEKIPSSVTLAIKLEAENFLKKEY